LRRSYDVQSRDFLIRSGGSVASARDVSRLKNVSIRQHTSAYVSGLENSLRGRVAATRDVSRFTKKTLEFSQCTDMIQSSSAGV
jgi:hypothetical protein